MPRTPNLAMWTWYFEMQANLPKIEVTACKGHPPQSYFRAPVPNSVGHRIFVSDLRLTQLLFLFLEKKEGTYIVLCVDAYFLITDCSLKSEFATQKQGPAYPHLNLVAQTLCVQTNFDGYSTYIELLSHAVEKLKAHATPPTTLPDLDSGPGPDLGLCALNPPPQTLPQPNEQQSPKMSRLVPVLPPLALEDWMKGSNPMTRAPETPPPTRASSSSGDEATSSSDNMGGSIWDHSDGEDGEPFRRQDWLGRSSSPRKPHEQIREKGPAKRNRWYLLEKLRTQSQRVTAV